MHKPKLVLVATILALLAVPLASAACSVEGGGSPPPPSIACDLNGDGSDDVLDFLYVYTGDRDANEVYVTWGHQEGAAATGPTKVLTLPMVRQPVCADFNGDGRADLGYKVFVYVDEGDDQDHKYYDHYQVLGKGDGSFQEPVRSHRTRYTG
jgi:hypothetical protein